MDLPQFGFVEDLDEGERLLVAGGGVDHIDVFGTATDQRGDGHDLGTQLLHYAKVEAQLIAVAQGDQRAGLHVRLFGQTKSITNPSRSSPREAAAWIMADTMGTDAAVKAPTASKSSIE